MNDLSFATIQELKSGLHKKEFSHQELLNFYLQRFAQHDPVIKSALELFDADFILKQHRNGSSGQAQAGLLDGIPGIIKDNICQQGKMATCSSKMLENHRAVYDATVITRLKDQGALLVGRANMDEFAMGSSTETSAFFKTKNPWNTNCVPGGSSGGSIAAVAAGLVPWSLGSDTGGSIRQPAGLCGIVGLKPTYGAVSRYGLIAYASSLDQVGPVTRTVYDNALVYSALAGHDKQDGSTIQHLEQKDYTTQLDGKLPKNFRIGIIKAAFETPALDSEVKTLTEQAIAQFKAAGASVVDIELPTLEYSTATYFIISRAEAASNFARFDGVRYGYHAQDAKNLIDLYTKSRSEGFGNEVKVRLLMGNYVLSAGYAAKFYHNAKKVQQMIARDFATAFEKVDVLMMPSQAMPAFEFGKFDHDKLQMDLQDYFLCPVNLAGIPAISVPCGLSKAGLPVGLQIIGPHLSEQLLFQAGHAYQQMTDWHTMHPKLVLA